MYARIVLRETAVWYVNESKNMVFYAAYLYLMPPLMREHARAIMLTCWISTRTFDQINDGFNDLFIRYVSHNIVRINQCQLLTGVRSIYVK